MKQKPPEAAPRDQWTLIRRVRQLLTLSGPSGPRRGSALGELGIVKDGALLLCNGVVYQAGTSRCVENLKQARNAKEIDAGGRIVVPAFVDPDAVLVYPPTNNKRSADAVKAQGPPGAAPDTGGTTRSAAFGGRTGADTLRDARLCLVSKRRLTQVATAAAADWVRSGVLTVGAHTGYAADLRDTLRILRIQKGLQWKPLQIRSVYSPVVNAEGEAAASALEILRCKALPGIRKRKLALMIELTMEDLPASGLGMIRQAAAAAAEAGYIIRIRMNGVPQPEMLALTLRAASIALIAPPVLAGASVRVMSELSQLGCVHVLPVTAAMRDDWKGAGDLRKEIDAGIPVAIASCFRPGGVTSLNPQFLLHLAVERCGMTPEEAIVASTYNAACSLRMQHTAGSLEPEKTADLLVMDVTDYRDLIHRVGHNDVMLVMRAGNIVYRRGPLTLD